MIYNKTTYIESKQIQNKIQNERENRNMAKQGEVDSKNPGWIITELEPQPPPDKKSAKCVRNQQPSYFLLGKGERTHLSGETLLPCTEFWKEICCLIPDIKVDIRYEVY